MDKISLKFILDSIANNNNNNTEDDKVFRKNTKEQITLRDSQYTKLLTHFISLTKFRNYVKEIFKWGFLSLSIISMACLIRIIYKLFNKYLSSENIEQIIQSIPLLITSMVSFVSAIIVIPATITKYLFNTEEDKNITSIIEHTQTHDVDGRVWAMKYKTFTENSSNSQNDKSSDDSSSTDNQSA